VGHSAIEPRPARRKGSVHDRHRIAAGHRRARNTIVDFRDTPILSQMGSNPTPSARSSETGGSSLQLSSRKGSNRAELPLSHLLRLPRNPAKRRGRHGTEAAATRKPRPTGVGRGSSWGNRWRMRDAGSSSVPNTAARKKFQGKAPPPHERRGSGLSPTEFQWRRPGCTGRAGQAVGGTASLGAASKLTRGRVTPFRFRQSPH
jgi:hypothetical protein